MDPDDTVDMDLLQQVADSLEKNRAKLVVFGHLEEYYQKMEALLMPMRSGQKKNILRILKKSIII